MRFIHGYIRIVLSSIPLGFRVRLIAQIGLLSPAKYSANNNNYLCNICAAHFTFSMGHAASTLAIGQAFSAHTRAHLNTLEHTHIHTHSDGGTRHRIYLCCIFVVAAVLAGFVNRKIDFTYVCVCIYRICVCVCMYIMYVCTHSHSLWRKTTFREYYTHSRALTLTQRHGHRHWQRLTPAAAQQFDGPKNNNNNNKKQSATVLSCRMVLHDEKSKTQLKLLWGKSIFTARSARRRQQQQKQQQQRHAQ